MESINTNSETPKNENEGKKTISSIEVDGIKLETEKYYFEYPKRIQQETGILGYERTIISEENLKGLAKKHIEKSKDIIADVISKLNPKKYSGDKDTLELLSNEERLFNVAYEDVCLRIFIELSEDNYPKKCFTHVMNRYSEKKGNTDKKNEENLEDFKKTGFFIQKIFDIDKQKNYDRSNRDNDSHDNKKVKSNATVFNKETGEKVNEYDFVPFDKITDPKSEYYQGIKEGKYFASTPFAGFNTGVGVFWGLPYFTFYKQPSFGFSMEDGFLNEYLNKALDIYLKELKGINFKGHTNNPSEMYGGAPKDVGINALIRELIFSDESVRKAHFWGIIHGNFYRFSDYFDSNVQEKTNEEFKKEKERLGIKNKKDFEDVPRNAVKEVVKKIEERHNINIYDYISDNYGKDVVDIYKWAGVDDTYSETELALPVFIGLENEIPQLSWGHAKYGHYVNDKGLNFFEFKHADHLPTKEEK